MADHWTRILEYLTYAEADASKAVSTEVRLAARTVLDAGHFEKVTTALYLVETLLLRTEFAFAEEETCVRAAWSIEPRLVAKAAVTSDHHWVLAVLEPTSDGLPRIVASLEGVSDATFCEAFASWSEEILDEERWLRNDEEWVHASRAAADDGLSEDERDAWANVAFHRSWDLHVELYQMEDDVHRGLYRELGSWVDVKRVVNLYYLMQDADDSYTALTTDHAAYLSSDWPDEEKRAAFIEVVSDHRERHVQLFVQDFCRNRGLFLFERDKTFSVLFKRYSTGSGHDAASLRFLFDDQYISSSHTPRQLKMQDGDAIYVHLLPPTTGYFSNPNNFKFTPKSPPPRASQDEIERARAARLARFA